MSAENELRELLNQNPEIKQDLGKFEKKALDLLGIEGDIDV